jgi:hypothetical protein
MPKFMVLYRSTVPPADLMADSTPEQMQAGMDAWMAWTQKCGDALVDLGSPLGGGTTVTAQSVSPSDGQLAGFSILDTGSIDEATALVQDHPHL